MPSSVWTPMILRAGSVLVFVIAIIVAGAANRSAMMVPAIAAVATIANLNTPRFSLNLSGAPKQGLIGRAMSVFLIRMLLFGVLFGFTVLIAAVFQETELAREFTTFDTILLTVPFGLALLFTAISMRSPLGNPEELMADIQKAFAEMQAGQGGRAANDDDAFTVDGEFEDRTED